MRPRLTLSLLALIAIATLIDYRLQQIIVHDSCEVLWYCEPMLNLELTDGTLEVQTRPGDASAHFQLGDAWLNRAEADRAIASYNRAIELDPTMATAYKKRGLAWRAKNFEAKATLDLKKSIELLTGQIQSNPVDANAYYQRALANRELASHQQAESDLTKAIALCTTKISNQPVDARTLFLRGQIARSQYDIEQAIGDFRRAIELAPAKISYRIELGLALCEQQNFEQAITEFNSAIEDNPREASYYRLRGRAWKEFAIKRLTEQDSALTPSNLSPIAMPDHQPGRVEYEKAIVDLTEAIFRDRNEWTAYRERAEINVLLGQVAAAIDDYQVCVSLAPHDYRPRIQLAVALAKNEKNQAAIRNLRVAIELKPTHADSYFLCAQLLFEVGDVGDAIYHLEQAMELDPAQAPFYQQKMQSWQVRLNGPPSPESGLEAQQSRLHHNRASGNAES